MREPEKATNAVDMTSQQLMEGTPVYDLAGAKIGTVDGYDAEANILAVRKGFFFPHDFYAPLSAITRSDPDGVYLNMTDEDLKGDGYAVASQAMTSEMAPITTSQTARVGLVGAPYAPDAANGDGDDDDADADYAADGADAFVAPQAVEVAHPSLDNSADFLDDGTGEITLPLAEEQLVPQVETVPLGDVRLHKGVRMVEREVTVPVGHDEVVVEHLAPDQFDASQPVASGEIIIPILEERVITQTVTVVKEYLRVRTKRVVEEQVVRAQTRQEYLDTGDDQRYVETRETREAPQPQRRDDATASTQAQPPHPTTTPPNTPPARNGSSSATTRRRRR